MLLGRGRPAALLAHEPDFAIMETFQPRPVPGMDHHRAGQKITHVFHSASHRLINVRVSH